METSVELHVERSGSGPPVVLAHGFGGSARNFRKQARALSDRWSVIAYDARGHGRSGAPLDPASYELKELVADLARLVAAEREPAVVGGLSLGAYTALRYALSAETRPRGLILASYPTPDTNAERVQWALGFAEAIDARGLDAAGAEFAWGESSRFDANSAALIRQGFLEHTPHALAAMLRSVIAHIADPASLGPELDALDVPTLVITGSDDVGAHAPSATLARRIPNAELVELPGAGHVVNLQAVSAFNSSVAAFLERVTG